MIRRVAVSVSLLCACVAAPPSVAVASGTTDLNAVRVANGLPPLRRSSRADAAARSHAVDMARNAFFSHTGSDGSRFGQRLAAAGCAPYGAENIAWGQANFDAVMRSWLGSPGHRRNILNRRATVYGWAVVDRNWVMVFTRGC